MNRELYGLLEEYKHSELDDDFIQRSFDLILEEEKELEGDFVSHLNLDRSLKSIGEYDFDNKCINVNSNNIIIGAMNREYYNEKLFALHHLRHEFEHAKALRRLFQFRKDIESTVLDYSLRGQCLCLGILPPIIPEEEPYSSDADDQNYLYNPGERIADIKSWKYVVNLIKNQRGTKDLLYARSMLYYSYIRGYEDNRYYLDPPTYTYLLNQRMFNNYKYLKRRIGEKEYSLDTRVLCGLPLTYQEYEKTLLRKLGLRIVRK